jgi:hypothetical protein
VFFLLRMIQHRPVPIVAKQSRLKYNFYKIASISNALTGNATCLHSIAHGTILWGRGEIQVTGKRSALIAGVFALWALGPGTAHAFEQKSPQVTPVPAPSTTESAAPANRPLSLEEIGKESKSDKTGRGIILPGIGKLSIPKFNFGLDLMYGNSEPSDSELGFSSDLGGDEDVTIMGKVKRRF